MSNVNPGNTDPNQLPGRPQLWQVDGRYYVAYYLYGSNTPVVWEGTADEIAEEYGGAGTPMPKPDVVMNGGQFAQKAPWLAGRVGEIQLGNDEDPWTQFYSSFNEQAELRPWMREPDMLAVIASAYLEGREPTADEYSRTNWWKTHTASERQWLEFTSTAGDAEIRSREDSAYRQVRNTLLQSGAAQVPENVVRWIAQRGLTGQWSAEYLNEQLAKLTDPYAPGQQDPYVRQLLIDNDSNPNGTRKEEDTVREMATRWLGPQMGQMTDDQIAQWAGKLRNDPDAAIEFEQHLKMQRQALFPKYTNPNLTYEDIVSPFRNLVQNVWGRPATDETMLADLANTGDYTEAQKRLRKMGLDQGVQKVVYDALGELSSTSLGDRVARSTI